MVKRKISGFLSIHFIVIAVSLLFSRIPLIGDFHYEFAALWALLFFICSGLFTIQRIKNNILSARPRFTYRLLLQHSSFSITPLFIILLFALILQERAYLEGVPFYLVYALPAPILGTLLAVGISGCFNRFRFLLFSLALLVMVLLVAVEMYIYPGVRFYSPLITLFPGTLYDEHIRFTPELLYYRLINLLYFGLFLLPFLSKKVKDLPLQSEGANALSIPGSSSRKQRNIPEDAEYQLIDTLVDDSVDPANTGITKAKKVLVKKRFKTYPPVYGTALPDETLRKSFFILWILAGLFFWYAAPEAGFATSIQGLQKALPYSFSTPHCTIFTAMPMKDSLKLKYIGAVHEAYYLQLQKFFQVNPGRIYSYLFPDAALKYQLIGAGEADLSKPHLKSVFINEDDLWGTLQHEMAHAFSSEFGILPFKLPAGFNNLLLEGAASAVEQNWGDYDVRYLSALIYKNKKGFSLQRQMKGLGFFNASGISYAIAGSFSRYIIEQKGIGFYKDLYQNGFPDSGKHSAPQLEEQYKNWLAENYSGYNDTDADSSIFQYYFGKVPLFERSFPHTVARLKVECREHYQNGRLPEALQTLHRVEQYSNEPDILNLKIMVLTASGRSDSAIVLLEKAAKTNNSVRMQSVLFRRLGDLYLKTGKKEKALQAYETIKKMRLQNLLSGICAANTDIILHSSFNWPPGGDVKTFLRQQITVLLASEPGLERLWYYFWIHPEGQIDSRLVDAALTVILSTPARSVNTPVLHSLMQQLILLGRLTEVIQLSEMYLPVTDSRQRASVVELQETAALMLQHNLMDKVFKHSR